MKRHSTLKSAILSFPMPVLLIACELTSTVNAQGTKEFDYIKNKSGMYYAVLELSNKEYLVIRTTAVIHKKMKIQHTFGRIGEISLSILQSNGKQTYIRGRVMDNGRNTTFYSQSSARQFVRHLIENS